MGLSLFIGDDEDSEIRLCDAGWYSKFLDYAATVDPFLENLLHFSPDWTRGIKGPVDTVTTEEVSLEGLRKECMDLSKDKKAPDFVKDISNLYIEAIDLCIQQEEVLTLN